jgi:hypothetical protein
MGTAAGLDALASNVERDDGGRSRQRDQGGPVGGEPWTLDHGVEDVELLLDGHRDPPPIDGHGDGFQGPSRRGQRHAPLRVVDVERDDFVPGPDVHPIARLGPASRHGPGPAARCRRPATTRSDLRSGSVCISNEGGIFMMTCTSRDDCREGYECDGKSLEEGEGDADACSG